MPDAPFVPPTPGASLSDFLTVLRQLTQAINAAALQYLNIQGAQNAAVISTPTLIHAGSGRICVVSVTTAGSTAGRIYDSTSPSATVTPIYVIPNVLGVTVPNLPYSFGLVVAPGTGQVVTVSYS